jgi:arylsulfatase
MSTPRPHLLFITTDQQRFDAIRAAGNPYIRTPHLDWLLESGIHFTRAYSESPVCCPARGVMLTGTHFHNMPPGHANFGQPTAPDPANTFPALLTRAGYQTKAVGKLHYSPARANYGWEDAEILEDYYRAMQRTPHLGVPSDHGLGQNEMDVVLGTVHESNGLTHWTVQQSIDFLETRDPTRPFALYTSFSKPHPPLDPSPNDWAIYANAEVDDPIFGDWSDSPEAVHAAWMNSTWSLSGSDRLSRSQLRDARRAYYAMTTRVDYTLGLLLARLREMNLLDQTMIVFTSDHGDMMGDHQMTAKATPFEGAMHVPMIVRPPAKIAGYEGLAGTRCDKLVSVADVFRTLTTAGQAQVPTNVAPDSLDLISVARGSAGRERLFGKTNGWHMVIEGQYKYAFHETGGAEILFDLAADPREQHELIRAGTHATVHQKMRQLIVDYATQRHLDVCRDGNLQVLRQPLSRHEVRASRSWPGFHHPLQTRDCVMH